MDTPWPLPNWRVQRDRWHTQIGLTQRHRQDMAPTREQARELESTRGFPQLGAPTVFNTREKKSVIGNVARVKQVGCL